MFDNLPALAALKQNTVDVAPGGLDAYLAAPCEAVSDDEVLAWWNNHRAVYGAGLRRMAVSYLTAPGTCYVLLAALSCALITQPASTVDVERVFSRGRLVLSHVRNRLSAESTRALLCVGEWSRKGLIKDEDILKVTATAYDANERDNVSRGWDAVSMGRA